MFMKKHSVSQIFRRNGQKGAPLQPYENAQFMLSLSRLERCSAKKMLKMQDDPTISMKTQGRATECRSKKRDFWQGNLRRRAQIDGNWPSNLTSVRRVGDALVVAGSGIGSRARVRGLGARGSGVIWCGTAILAVTVHGRDARGTSK